MAVPYHVLDVFTDTPFGGNPLAVVLEAQRLDEPVMARIAQELNLSETVFVLPSAGSDAAFRLRIFTPSTELPFAGHPTIGTAVLLAALGLVGPGEFVLDEGVGPVRVSADASSAQLTAAALPRLRPAPAALGAVAAALSLGRDDVVGDSLVLSDAGVPFVLVPVRDEDALARIRLDHGRWERELAPAGAGNFYAFVRDGSRVRSRMFGPAIGIPEDPATGAAATALAGALAHGEPDGTARWEIDQGVEMGRPSRLRVEADIVAARAVEIRVAGAAVRVAEGRLLV